MNARKEVINVVTRLADIMALFLVRKEWGVKEKCEIYRYGCEIAISAIINVTIVLLIGLVFRNLRGALLFYVLFIILRRYCGGYHAETYLGCNTIFAFTMVVVLIMTRYCIYISSLVLITTAFISFLIVLRYSPLIHKNKMVSEAEVKKYRIISCALSSLLLILVPIFAMNYKEIALLITLAMEVTSFAMIVTVLQERRRKR